MNKVMVITALAASLLVSTAAIAAPANLADALAPEDGLTLVRGGVGGGGSAHMGGIGGPSGGAGAHFSGNDHIGGPVGGPGRPSGWPGPHLGANDHFDNGRGHFDHDHFDHGHGHHARFFPGNVFVYGGYGDYDYGYSGDCSWLRRQAAVTGSRYWWRRYQACLY